MKNIIKLSAAALVLSFGMASCIEEVDPQTSYVTIDQAAAAPGSFDNFVTACTGTICGSFIYNSSSQYPWDFGYPSLMLQRDMEGMDIVIPDMGGNDWYSGWYTVSSYISSEDGTGNLMPWYFYYKWINSCNTVIQMAGETPDADKMVGSGIAHAMRAFYYLELAQTYEAAPYTKDTAAVTVPIVTESTENTTENPRASNRRMYEFILSDLKTAESQLADYERPDMTTPDLSVVYGTEARAYLLMGDWQNASAYAQKAITQGGRDYLTPSELTDQSNGFNNPNNKSWMFCYTHKSTDPNIKNNDGDSSWGSQMIIEVGPSACGYSANYCGPKRIDKHLYESIPASDYRKMWWMDFAIDDMDEADQEAAVLKYTSSLDNLNIGDWVYNYYGGAPVKFRPANGEHADQYAAWCVSIPLMRFEEMQLIKIEADGRMNEATGIEELKAFALQRDPNYVYGSHEMDMSYPGDQLSVFLREVWFQRRVELWGEGFATEDLKRLNKGIVRNYSGTNHAEDYRFNTDATPAWCFQYIPSSYEKTYNSAIDQNATYARPSSEGSEYTW